MTLEVVEPGLLSVIEDHGRAGVAHLGLRRCGAADARALAVANLLVGLAPGAAAVEMTLLGATFAVRADCVVAIAGADMGARVIEEDRPLAPGASYRLGQGTTLAFSGAIDGARTYLALAGGLRADHVLGSASTDRSAGVGGLAGRALRAGDLLATERAPSPPRSGWQWPAGTPASGIVVGDQPRRVSVTRGPHAERLDRATLAALTDGSWRVSSRSDRAGIRLDGAPLFAEGALDAAAAAGGLLSLPVLPGAVQVPPQGRPIVLLADAPTVGGYLVPIVVIEADMPVLGQLMPGDELRFEVVEADEARRRAASAAASLEAAARQLASR